MQENRSSFVNGVVVAGLVIGAYFFGTLSTRILNQDPVDLFGQLSFLQNTPLSNWLPKNNVGPTTTPLGDLIKQGKELTIPDVVEAAGESVVTVAIKKQQTIVDPFSGGLFNFGPFSFGNPAQQRTEQIQRDIGTGFVVDSQGKVVTNKHVVSDAQAEYLVVDKEGNEHKVEKIYRDPTNDLAIVQVADLKKPALPLGDSDTIRVGESVIAIGTALGEFRHTVTTGVVSGLGRGITAGDGLSQFEEIEGVIQTDAAINPGNSGGPLINARGEVIGVNVAVSQSAENIGFALPINVIKASLENFNATGQFERPMLGVRYQMITERAALTNEVPQGAYVAEVVENSTAAKIGIQPGDIITMINGSKLKDTELVVILNKLKVGQSVKIEIWREGEFKELEATLQSETVNQ